MSIFNTGRYVTAAMAEKAAQECSAFASWFESSDENNPPRASMSDLVADTWRECLQIQIQPGNAWAEAEARLRSGWLPPCWWWRSRKERRKMIEGTNWNAATMALFRVGKVKP